MYAEGADGLLYPSLALLLEPSPQSGGLRLNTLQLTAMPPPSRHPNNSSLCSAPRRAQLGEQQHVLVPVAAASAAPRRSSPAARPAALQLQVERVAPGLGRKGCGCGKLCTMCTMGYVAAHLQHSAPTSRVLLYIRHGPVKNCEGLQQCITCTCMSSHPQPLPPCHAFAQPDLLRGLSILANVPMILTLMDYEQGAVFQNDLSVW